MEKEKITPENSAIAIVDMQERLLENQKYQIIEKDEVIESTRMLVEAATILGMAVISLEQEKLGPTHPRINEVHTQCPSHKQIEKSSFSCYDSKDFRENLSNSGKKNITLCGVEAHICIVQTAEDLLRAGYNVHIVKVAVSSHQKSDLDTAIDRLYPQGCTITSAEMFLYELLRDAKSPHFKDILRLVKRRRDAKGVCDLC